MFNVNFYPTPREVIERMTFGIDLYGKNVLEPSAGSGNIISFAKELGAKVTACEINQDLATIAARKADKFLKHDFMHVTAEEVSHINYILMNPPFTADEKHILHAFDIAPEGCEIVALCNWNTIKNAYSSYRVNLKNIIEKHGSSECLGDVFAKSERETDVNIGLIKLFKPKTGDMEFEDYFFDMTEQQEEVVEGSGIMKHNDVREIVNRYVAAVKMFSSVIDASDQMNSLIGPINGSGRITFGVNQKRDGRDYTITRDEFKKELQKSAWKTIFDKMKMEKYVTKSVMADINKYVEHQQKVPFTMTNIYKMIEIIFGTHASRMERVLVDAFDKICSFSADNSEAGEKWKTNSSYKVNQKFIIPGIVAGDYSYMRVSYYSDNRQSDMDDIVKAICFITGRDYGEKERNENVEVNKFPSLWEFTHNTYRLDKSGNRLKAANGYSDILRELEHGKWHVWNEFFEIRGYKKGTLHVKFRSEAVWMEFNKRVAKIKGWTLPRKTDTKTKGTERTKKAGVDLFNY